MSDNIVCSARDLKKKERYGTMQECAKKGQIRRYGLYKVDKKILNKSKKSKDSAASLKKKHLILIARITKFKKERLAISRKLEIEEAKEDDRIDPKKIADFKAQIKEINKNGSQAFTDLQAVEKEMKKLKLSRSSR